MRNSSKEFDGRRHLFCSRLNEIERSSCTLPKGAFCVFPNLRGACSAFDRGGEGYARIFYAAVYERLEEALDRIGKAAQQLG